MSKQKTPYEVATTFQVAFGKGNQVTGYVRDPENPDPLVHPAKPYWFSRDTLPFLLNWWELGQGEFGLLLHGPAGSGKTSLVEQTLARLAVLIQSVVCHERLDLAAVTAESPPPSSAGAESASSRTSAPAWFW